MTLEFSLFNPVSGTDADIDDVQLIDATGRNLLENGDFSQGGDRWFFQSDNHILWHVKNLYVSLVFEQGWFGLLTFVVLIVLALRAAWGSARQGSAEAAGLWAGLCGFLIVGLFDSPFDAPRLTTLFLLWFFVALAQERGVCGCPGGAANAATGRRGFGEGRQGVLPKRQLHETGDLSV